VEIHVAPGSSGDWKADGATYGKAITKKQTTFGYRPHPLVTMSRLIMDFELTFANCPDMIVGFELLCEHTDLEILGDKTYICTVKEVELLEKNQMPCTYQHLQNAIQQLIETVNGQLSSQFEIEKNFTHTFWGLCTRLYSKLTAHTL
jgi:hypothetical protein